MAWRLTSEMDLLIVSGGGQIDDFWGGPWGHPYALLKWTWLAKIRGKRVAILGTGTGSLDSKLSRLFTRLTLPYVSHLSFRDQGSRALVQRIGVNRPALVGPDLAFSLDAERVGAATPVGPSGGSAAISPMAFKDPRAWPDKDGAIYRTYLEGLIRIADALLKEGLQVRVTSSDTQDRVCGKDLVAGLTAMGHGSPNVEFKDTLTVSAFLAQAAESDVVIASRLHGVILAYLAGAPVIALSYDRKVQAVMNELGQSDWCFNINEFDPDEVVARVLELRLDSASAKSSVRTQLQVKRSELDAQYDRLLADWMGTS